MQVAANSSYVRSDQYIQYSHSDQFSDTPAFNQYPMIKSAKIHT